MSFYFLRAEGIYRMKRSDNNREEAWQQPTPEEIRKRAYELYLERQRECGGPLDDWLEAEAELLLRP
jgi:hypothetical protein